MVGAVLRVILVGYIPGWAMYPSRVPPATGAGVTRGTSAFPGTRRTVPRADRPHPDQRSGPRSSPDDRGPDTTRTAQRAVVFGAPVRVVSAWTLSAGMESSRTLSVGTESEGRATGARTMHAPTGSVPARKNSGLVGSKGQ